MNTSPHVVERVPLQISDAKWITLKKLKYVDQDGNDRLWECAERTTRKGDIDAVAVFALLKSKTNKFPPSTVIIEQYRPPLDKVIIEFPAGLVDAAETPERAAIRELEEETGYKASSVLESSPILAGDPGISNANMKLVSLSVELEGEMETPTQNLEVGEHIEIRVVELSKLQDQLNEYSEKGCIIDSRLSSFATGYEMAKKYV